MFHILAYMYIYVGFSDVTTIGAICRQPQRIVFPFSYVLNYALFSTFDKLYKPNSWV